jgi:hypothetical protein
MKTKRHAFRMSLLQVARSPLFYLAVIGVCALCFFSVGQYMKESWKGIHNQSVLYFFDLFIGLSMYKKLVVLFTVIPYAASFCSDWNCQFIKPVVIRTGVSRYIWSKITTCFLSAFFAVWIGIMLFVALMSTIMPVMPVHQLQNMVAGSPFESLAYSPLPVLYLFAEATVYSLAAALWSVVGLTVSAYMPNRFVAIATPVIAGYLLENLSMNLPVWLNLYLLTRSANVLKQGPAVSFAYFVFIFLLLSFLFGLVFSRQVRRRLRNEIV